MVSDAARWLVLRVPTSGPPALIAPPNDFASEDEARARIAVIMERQRMAHHTHFEILRYQGERSAALAAAGAIF